MAKNKKEDKYYKGLGRRKTSVANVRLYEKKGGGFEINGKKLEKYFPGFELQKEVTAPLVTLDYNDKFFVSVKVFGGGVQSQATATCHGIARALLDFDSELRKQLKVEGYLTRDPRMRERKKPGLKRARRAPQWRKR